MVEPTDAVIRTVAACVCGSDLWRPAWRPGAGARVPAAPLLDLVWTRQINPGRVFDLDLPLSEVAEAYRAMDERRAIKAILRP